MPRPIAQDHGDKRSAILRSAAQLFAEEGYGRATMAQVAARCGISKAAIYHYYSGKEALLFDILDRHLRGLRDQICALDHDSPHPEAQLRRITAEILIAYKGREAEHAVQLNALTALPEPQQTLLKGYQRDLVAEVRSRIVQLAPAPLNGDAPQLRALTFSLFAMLNWHCQWDAGADDARRRGYADLICTLLIAGLPAVNRPN